MEISHKEFITILKKKDKYEKMKKKIEGCKRKTKTWEKLGKTFLDEERNEDFSALDYFIDFYFPKHKLAIKIGEFSHADRDSITNK